jgi:hypothetical protein
MGPKGKFLRFLFRSGLFDPYISRLHTIVEEHQYEKFSSLEVLSSAEAISELLEIFDPINHDFVRLGNEHDGGYVIVDTLKNLDSVLSLGVGSDISFEESLSSHVNRIDLYDHTVSELPIKINNANFFKLGISEESHPDFVTLSDAVESFGDGDNVLLKMDIESSEWKVLASTPSTTLNRFQQIVVEFHGLLNIDNPERAVQIIEALRNLNQTHKLVHLHVNNYEPIRVVGGIVMPNVLEATYLKATDAKFIRIPSPRGLHLNHQNNPDKIDISTKIRF